METHIFTTLHESYLSRCHQPDQQKKAWQAFVQCGFAPDITKDWETRPSVLLARESGDMGMALLWVVQAALIRPSLTYLSEAGTLDLRQKEELAKFDEKAIGALAHSEPPGDPLTVAAAGKSLLVNGEKKYVTGGKIADFLFITGRRLDAPKVSCILWTPGSAILEDELVNLDLDALFTSTHARLVVKNKKLPPACLLPLSPPDIRRMIAVWSTVERTLIIEAFTALLQYIVNQTGIKVTDKLDTIMHRQQEATSLAIQRAFAGEFVYFPTDDLIETGHIAEMLLKEIAAENAVETTGDTALTRRLNDAAFIHKFWKQK